MPRPKSYEPDDVLNKAMRLFWSEGYETTSIPKLEKHLGINRFGIYNTFSSKHELFVRALDLYTGSLLELLVEPLETGTEGVKDLRAFAAGFVKFFLSQNLSRGCLLCNSATELGNRDEAVAKHVTAYFDRVESAVSDCLLRARELGELNGDDSALKSRAKLARLTLQGILVDLRLGRSKNETRRALEALIALLTQPQSA